MWLADHLRGKDVLLLAGSNAEAADLARRVQTKLAQLGTVGPPKAALADGNRAGIGDLVGARLNTTIDANGRPLTNRDTLQITAFHGPDAEVRRQRPDGTWTNCHGGGQLSRGRCRPGADHGSSGHKITARWTASWITELPRSARVSATSCSSQDATKVTGPSGGSG